MSNMKTFPSDINERMVAKALMLFKGVPEERLVDSKITPEDEFIYVLLHTSLDADKLANELHELSEDICKNLGSGVHSITYSASEWRRLDAKIQKILEQQSDTLYLLKKLADQAVSWSPERMNKPDTPVHTDIKAVQTVPRRGRRVPWLLRVQSTTSRYQALEKRMEVPA